MISMRYGLVTAGIAALAVAATAGVIAVDRPTDQAGARLLEAPIRVVPAAPASSATIPGGPSPAESLPNSGSEPNTAHDAPATPPPAPTPGTPGAPGSTEAPGPTPSPTTAPTAPTRVDPAPAQPVGPGNSGKHRDADDATGAGNGR
jgi:hypothetical protein